LSLLNATKHLHDHKAIHGEIRVENVLIDEEYHIKLVEKALLSTTNWSIELGKENITLIRGRGVLFSPCLLRCLFHQRTQLADYDAFKADVYAVGMILLECASLRNAGEFYDYEKFSVRGS
jgi:serine/threonine protein kinase